LGMVFQRRHVSGSNRLFRSKSPSDRHPYSPILVHSPLTIAQSVCNEVLLDVCEFVGGLTLFGMVVQRADTFLGERNVKIAYLGQHHPLIDTHTPQYCSIIAYVCVPDPNEWRLCQCCPRCPGRFRLTRASGDGSDSDRPNIVSASCSDSSSDSSKEASDCPSAPEKLPREKVRHSRERGR
jgi:hypothetical protein